MANISYIETTKSQLNNINIVAGQRIICTDTGEEYYDDTHGNRVYIGDNIKTKVNEVTTQLNKNISNLQKTKAEKTDLENANNIISQISSNIALQNSRINNFAKLAEGSTTGDAELQDIRIGTDGTTYTSAGEAVRTQFENIAKKQSDDEFMIATKATMMGLPHDEGCIITFNNYTKELKINGTLYIRKQKGNCVSFMIKDYKTVLKDYDVIYVEMDYIKKLTDPQISQDKIEQGTIYSDFDPSKHIPLFWYSFGNIATSTNLKINVINKESNLNTIKNILIAYPYTEKTEITFNTQTRELKTGGSIYIRKQTDSKNIRSFIIPAFTFTLENFDVIYVDIDDIQEGVSDLTIDQIKKGTIYNDFDPSKHIPLFWYSFGNIATSTNLKINKKTDKLNIMKTGFIAYPYTEKIKITFNAQTRKLKTEGSIYIRKVADTSGKKNIIIPSFTFILVNFDVVYVDIDDIQDGISDFPAEKIKKGNIYSDFDSSKHIPLFWYANGQIMTSLGLEITKINKSNILREIKSTLIAFPYSKNLNIVFDKNTKELKTDGIIYIKKPTDTQNKKSIMIPPINFTLSDFEIVYIDINDVEDGISDFPAEKIKKGVIYEDFDSSKHIPLFWYANNKIMTSLGLPINAINDNIDIKKETDNKKIVCFGDSITELKHYPDKLANLTGYTVYDCSFAGSVMSYHSDKNYENLGFRRLVDAICTGDYSAQDASAKTTMDNGGSNKLINLNTLKSIDFNNIDICILFIGTNDFGATGGIPLESKGDNTARTFEDGMRYGLQTMISKYPNLQFYIITPMWRGNIKPNGVGKVLLDYVNTEIKVANEYNFPVLDFYHNCGINDFNKGYLLNEDELHPTEKGDTLIAQKICNFIHSR